MSMGIYEVVINDCRKSMQVIEKSTKQVYFQVDFDQDENDMVVSRNVTLPANCKKALELSHLYTHCLTESMRKWCSSESSGQF
jgi:hypothetical protein